MENDRPQRLHSSVLPHDLLPKMEDESAFFRRAVLAVLQVVTRNFDFCAHLESCVVDERSDYVATATEIHPFALLDIDESFIDNNIEILLKPAKDVK